MGQDTKLSQQDLEARLADAVDFVFDNFGVILTEEDLRRHKRAKDFGAYLNGEKPLKELKEFFAFALRQYHDYEPEPYQRMLNPGHTGGHHAEAIGKLLAWRLAKDHHFFKEIRQELRLPIDGSAPNSLIYDRLREVADLEDREALGYAPSAPNTDQTHRGQLNGGPDVVHNIEKLFLKGTLTGAYLAIRKKRGTLSFLKVLAGKVASDLQCYESEALAFILQSRVPPYRHMRALFAPGWVRRADRIVLTIDPALSGNDVKRAYDRLRKVIGAYDRPCGEEAIALVETAMEPDFERLPYDEQLRQWNAVVEAHNKALRDQAEVDTRETKPGRLPTEKRSGDWKPIGSVSQYRRMVAKTVALLVEPRRKERNIGV